LKDFVERIVRCFHPQIRAENDEWFADRRHHRFGKIQLALEIVNVDQCGDGAVYGVLGPPVRQNSQRKPAAIRALKFHAFIFTAA
jgi:hypothetical protein